MTYPHAPYETGPTLENLARRQELFRLIRDSHLQWMYKSKDQTMKERHRALANLLDDIMKEYAVLLEALRSLDGI